MGRRAPSEEEQFELYRRLATGMKGKSGDQNPRYECDKDTPCLNLAKEENPAPGKQGAYGCACKGRSFQDSALSGLPGCGLRQ